MERRQSDHLFMVRPFMVLGSGKRKLGAMAENMLGVYLKARETRNFGPGNGDFKEEPQEMLAAFPGFLALKAPFLVKTDCFGG